jgi:hypothetical protein
VPRQFPFCFAQNIYISWLWCCGTRPFLLRAQSSISFRSVSTLPMHFFFPCGEVTSQLVTKQILHIWTFLRKSEKAFEVCISANSLCITIIRVTRQTNPIRLCKVTHPKLPIQFRRMTREITYWEEQGKSWDWDSYVSSFGRSASRETRRFQI